MKPHVPNRMKVDQAAKFFREFSPEERLGFLEQLGLTFKSPVEKTFDAYERWTDDQRAEFHALIDGSYCVFPGCGALLLEDGRCRYDEQHEEEDDDFDDEDGEEDDDDLDDDDEDDEDDEENDGNDEDGPDSREGEDGF